MAKKIQIFNTGGTFNKIYNPISGELEVIKNNIIIESIFHKSYMTNKRPKIDNLIHKDSLDINIKDRKELVKVIKRSKYKRIVIIHGTDTMDITAKYINKKVKDKKVVIVGAMQPFSIEPIESTASLMMAIGFLSAKSKNDIYISMNGIITKYKKIQKNYKKGLFECQ